MRSKGEGFSELRFVQSTQKERTWIFLFWLDGAVRVLPKSWNLVPKPDLTEALGPAVPSVDQTF